MYSEWRGRRWKGVQLLFAYRVVLQQQLPWSELQHEQSRGQCRAAPDSVAADGPGSTLRLRFGTSDEQHCSNHCCTASLSKPRCFKAKPGTSAASYHNLAAPPVQLKYVPWKGFEEGPEILIWPVALFLHTNAASIADRVWSAEEKWALC